MNPLSRWQRLEFLGRPVYLLPDKPDWFVPDATADRLLSRLLAAGDATPTCDPADQLVSSQLLAQLAAPPAPPYGGRAASLTLSRLKECWFHVTDQCNLACRHCLFAASPAATRSIDPQLLKKAIGEARALGASLFYFTGGEPMVYPGFFDLAAELLADPQVHVVVLTNGMLLLENKERLAGLPKERLHLQISMDGLAAGHEALRGKGSFARLLDNLEVLKELAISPTLSVAASSANLAELPELVSFAAEHGFVNIHFLWHFVRGKGSREQFVSPAELLPQLIKCQEIAEARGISIDNLETLKAQVFSTPGTRHDLSNAGWESIAVGPDGRVYPSPALVGVAELDCGPVADGLERVWRESPVLNKIRQASLLDSPELSCDPLRFLVGGGDLDHSFLAGQVLVGADPYLELYRQLALWLMVCQAQRYENRAPGSLLLRMGDVRHDCPDGGQEVSLTHCNCVISLSNDHGHTSVREFYGQAALAANEEIVNPFAPEQATATFIPLESRKRSYGCGSPVNDAGLKKGEVLVDLGSGSGVECFMGSEKVGPKGRVYGIDMTDEMLELARSAQAEVAVKLGYGNVEFRKGYLEAIPLDDSQADVVISNCVINLSPDKRRTFHEIYRVLKPGGRLVISDIVTDGPIPTAIRNNDKFRGECLGGAMQQLDLLAMLRGVGFTASRLIKRFPYRLEGDTQFYSLTFVAYKPAEREEVEVIYRGPFASVTTSSGRLLLNGQRLRLPAAEASGLGEAVFVVDEGGAVTNLQMANSCCPSPAPTQPAGLSGLPVAQASSGCCGSSAEAPEAPPAGAKIVTLPPAPRSVQPPPRHGAGCMACGSELVYLPTEQELTCYYCGVRRKNNAVCREGHFICDDCHQQDGLQVIKLICTETREQDMLALLRRIRRHPALPMHGPEHHAMVPGIILATYRNLGGNVSRESILTAIDRGSKVPGGVCGFWGSCGAAAGVGIAFSVLLDATPITPAARQQAQQVTARVLARIAETRGGRCCQREAVTALMEAARVSTELLPVALQAEQHFCCEQWERNRECIRNQCFLWCEDAARQRSS